MQPEIRVAYLLDDDVATELARLWVDLSLQYPQVWMRPVRDHAKNSVIRVARGALVIGAGQQAAGETESERRFADPGWPAEQPSWW